MGKQAGDGQVFRITGARASLTEDVRGRQRRYVISMLIRTVCVVLAVVLWHVERYLAVLALIGGALLPYIAVVVANAGRERAPGLPSTFDLSPQARPMLGPGGAGPRAPEARAAGGGEAPGEEPGSAANADRS